jgi:hypothetical protein
MGGTAPPPFYAYDPDIGRLAVSTPDYGTAVVAVNRSAFPYGGLELARLFDGQGDPIGAVGARPPATFAVTVSDTRGRRVVSTAAGLHITPKRPPLVLRSPAGTITRTPKGPHAYGGTFSTLQLTGHRRTRGLVLTTRHRFDATGITERWTVRQTGRRKTWRPLRVDVLAPSWGGSAAISANLSDGRIFPLPPGESVPMHLVRRFLVASDRGAYWLTLIGPHNGIAGAETVPAQRSSPTPGPTLRITPAHAARFRAVTLEARITPLAERPR